MAYYVKTVENTNNSIIQVFFTIKNYHDLPFVYR